MSCRTDGRFIGPYISDPWALAQARLLCDGICNVNSTSCVPGYAVAGCAVPAQIPENFPVNI